MDASTNNQLAAIGTWAAVVLAIWKSAEKYKPLASPQASETALSLFQPHRLERETAAWAAAFADVVNVLFTSKHWTKKCLMRSCCFSFGAIAVGTVLLAFIRPMEVRDGYLNASWVDNVIHAWAIMLTLLIDFLALWFTRRLVDTARTASNFGMTFCIWASLFVIHFILAFSLHVFRLVSSNLILVSVEFVTGQTEIFFPRLQTPLHFVHVVWDLLIVHVRIPEWLVEVPLIWSTFLTAFWMLLYVLAQPVVKVGRYGTALVEILRKVIDVDKEPILTVAAILVVTWTLLWFFILLPLTRFLGT